MRPRDGEQSYWDDSKARYVQAGFKTYWETIGGIAHYQYERVSGNGNTSIEAHSLEFVRQRFGDKKLNCLLLGCSEMSEFEFKFRQSGLFNRIVVMDIAGGLLERQRREAAARGYDIDYVQADFNSFTLDEASFDVVFGWGTIHHIEKLEHLFEQVRKALRPRGVLLAREYVGPNRIQLTDLQLSLASALLQLLPEKYRRRSDGSLKNDEPRSDEATLIKMDPSESIRSQDILKVASDYFSFVSLKRTGGTLLHPLLSGIAGHFDVDGEAEAQSLLASLVRLESILVDASLIPSDFVFFIGEPKSDQTAR